ncbi:transcriptional regulator [Parafrankia colletiae]|uniref:Transcriptional regulator n=1 Tax=Parafrankia colletiae TaxID=573497 RepID=A0A1S1RGV4_9ACTN|nr:BTAD domain-containing putative transcriptional regulator [Parafrankia colletiae]MCK9903189.1 AAA family ATPase [Frankia sp. Cpl3]OHV44981.1 transcriptional regulator [Parafrankia colletiae]
MRFGVLGAITVRDGQDRDVDVGTGRAATLLALLLAQRNAPLSPARLADQLWAGEPPATAATTLQGWISRLRRLLEPGVPASQARLLVTRTAGYQIVLPDPIGQLDAEAFRRDASTLQRELRDGWPARAAEAGRAALDRWRGEDPYGGLLDEALPEVPSRLREERLVAVERYLLARLDLGDHFALSAELAALVESHPTRESLWGMRVLALYRSDRQADALAVFARVRDLLRDEMGLDPAATLRTIETAVRQMDPAAWRPGWWPGRLPGPARPPEGLPGPGPARLPEPSRPSAPAQPTAPARSMFVGRATELEALLAVAATVRAGARSAVVSGPAGVGKTRLLAEAVPQTPTDTSNPSTGRLASRWVRCHPGDDAAPYDVWRRLFPAARPQPDTSVRSWAFAVVETVRADTDRGPLAIVVDDLQWADAASLRVLTIVVRELATYPVLFAATVREVDGLGADGRTAAGDDLALGGQDPAPGDGDPVHVALAALGRLPGERLRVGPLTAAAVAEYVAATVPSTALTELTAPAPPARPPAVSALSDDSPRDHEAEAVAAVVAERSAGNAFFMTELTRLVAAGRPARDLPERVIDVVSAQVSGLGEPAHQLLRAAAVLGHDVPVDVVVEVTGVGPPAHVDAALEAAVRAGLLADEPGLVRFTHALVREGLVARTTRRVQAGWHRRCAEVLAARGAGGVEAVARHLLLGDDPGGPQAALAAAEAALVVADFDGAYAWARRGLDAADPGDGALRARLGLAAGRAQRLAGRLDEAAVRLTATYDDALAADEPDLAALVALEHAGGPVTGYWSLAGETAPSVLARLTSARSLPGITAPTAGAVDAACAVRFALAGDGQRAERHLSSAQAALAATTAGQDGVDADASRRLEWMVLLARFVTAWRPDLAAERLTILDRLGELAAHDVGARLTAAHLRALTVLELGRLDEADGLAHMIAVTARRLRYDDFSLVASWWDAMRDLMSGRLEDAMTAAEAVFSPLLVASPEAAVVARTSVEAIGGMVAWENGALLDAMPDATGPPPTDHLAWLVVRALALAQGGRVDESMDVLAPVLQPGLPAVGDGPPATSSLILLTEWCWYARSRQWAEPLLDRVEPWAETVVVFAPGGVCMGSGHLYVGTLATVLGDRVRGRRELDAAIAANARLGMPRFAARARERRQNG